MTREEAIKYWEKFLKEIPEIIKEGFPQDEAEEQEHATVMAIKALQEPEIIRCTECRMHSKCLMEDTFITVGITDGYCRVGTRRKDEQSTNA